ncbi:hypothetical protein [Mucilaginibacter aquaedulcis]|uniref:hypothetical protein n=1 Tax=Mucilaginibacter aquaedulcis TaxID=1187081 RepID=UPI0025B57864|nr:hypothetical protein [Mucilaginibacter aquaedulcis]MDN3551635.1 hypothetical protein [Mucilaginibacter aquaedulcis]
MEPLRFTLGNRKKLLVIPDTIAHLNGHAVLTFTYSIFADDGLSHPLRKRRREDSLHLEKIDDPNYCGYITFEKPGHIFTYNPGDMLELDGDEVEEIIEHLSHVRDNPTLWNISGY